MDQEIDQGAVTLAKAIRQTESGGDFNLSGKSGEKGAYQFMPNTWKGWSKQYLGKEIPLEQATPEQQNAVAYRRIKELKDQGKDVTQIAATWNSGSDKGWQDKVSTGYGGKLPPNKYGVEFDVPSYVNKVAKTYYKMKNGTFPESDAQAIVQGSTQAVTGQGDGGRLGGVAKTVGGALDYISKPFVDVAAIPLQAGIKGWNAVTGQNVQDPFSQGEGYGLVAKERLSDVGDIKGKGGSLVKAATETAIGAGGLGLIGKLTGASSLRAPEVVSAMAKFKMPMAEFNSLSKVEKLNALGEALKTAQAGDAMKIAKAMDYLKPGAGILKKITSMGLESAKGYALWNLLGPKVGSFVDAITDK